MRTAEEILETFEFGIHIYGNSARNDIINAINEARKEAIEECAEKAIAQLVIAGNDPNVQTLRVDKQSILSLIKELK